MDVQKFDPENNQLLCGDRDFTYDNLILAPELEFDWDQVEGLLPALRDY